MQARSVEGDFAANTTEVDKLWNFTEKLIKEADEKRADNKVNQSEPESEPAGKSEEGNKEVGQGDKKSD